MNHRQAMSNMHPHVPPDAPTGNTAASRSGDDHAQHTRMMSRSQPQPAHEDNRVECEQPEGERLEAAPLESEQLFRTTFDRAVIGIAHVSPEGRWLRANQRLCDLLGYDCAELATRTCPDLTYADDLPATLASFERLLAGKVDMFEMDKRYVRKDGTLVWVHLTASPVRTPQGAPNYCILMVQDIAERKRLEHERADVLEQERAAHAAAKAMNAQLQALQALTDTALSHLTLDDLLRELLDRVTAVMGVEHVGILLLDEDGRTLTVRAVGGPLKAAVGRMRIPVGKGLAGRIAASWTPLIGDDRTHCDLDGVPPILREHVRSAVGVPLLVEDPLEDRLVSRLLGVLQVGSATSRRFSEADVQLLQRAADRVALAVDRARLYAAEQDARQQAEAAQAKAQASEAEATARAEQLHTIVETMADGVAVYDTASRPVQMNRAYRELLGLEQRLAGFVALPVHERLRLLHVRNAVTGAPLLLEHTPVGRALRGEVVTGADADIRVRAFNGRELLVNNSAAPLRDGDGQIVGAVALLRDLTERKRLERERTAAHAAERTARFAELAARSAELAARADELAAHDASRRLEAFLAVAAHDLRTPLTAVVGFLDLASHQTEQLAAAAREANPDLAPSVEAVRSRLDDAGQGAERLTRLLGRLFDLAAIRAGKLELRKAPCDLLALVRQQVAAQRMAAPGRTIRLHAPADGGPIPIEADADRVDQVVANYLTNALKYAPADRTIDVSVEMPAQASPQLPPMAIGYGRWTRVAVRDRGQGLPEAEQVRVWGQFHRAPGVVVQRGAPSGAEGGGLGLGLYICKAIIEAHGGQVGVESVVGQGSTFWFTLPVSTPVSKPVSRTMSGSTDAGGGSP